MLYNISNCTNTIIMTIYMKNRSLLLPFLTLLSCNTFFSRNIEHHSVNATPAETETPLGGVTPPKDGQVVPSMASKALGYRYPQMPLEVDGYEVAPPNLQLEQVHIYVRHGAFLKIKGLSEPSTQSWLYGPFRGAYAGWCPSSQSTSISSRTLDNV